jgi:hypothetical protein
MSQSYIPSPALNSEDRSPPRSMWNPSIKPESESAKLMYRLQPRPIHLASRPGSQSTKIRYSTDGTVLELPLYQAERLDVFLQTYQAKNITNLVLFEKRVKNTRLFLYEVGRFLCSPEHKRKIKALVILYARKYAQMPYGSPESETLDECKFLLN